MRKVAVWTLAVSVLFAIFVAGSISSTKRHVEIAVQRSGAVRLIAKMDRGITPPRLPNGLFIPVPSGGMAAAVTEGKRAHRLAQASPRASVPGLTASINGCRNVFHANHRPANVRANVDCGFRFQSEEWVAVNPTDPDNVVVSQNDSKLSGNRTGVEFSLNGGRRFGDSVLPNGRVSVPEAPGGEWSFDAFSDPIHAFDSRGNLYYTAVGFDAFQDPFSGVFVWKSNSCLKGSVLHTPGSGSCDPPVEPLSASAAVVHSTFDNVALSDDKENMAVDRFETSPFRDNVYVTWTLFDFGCGPEAVDYCESPIVLSRSTDGGVTWSDPVEISGVNPDICDFGDLFRPTEDVHACNFSQGSYPLVGPDGTIYVVFNNSNTSPEAAVIDGVAQQLFVKSTDGGLTWSAPVKVGDDYQTQPYSIPGHELPNGCPDFRPCLPPNGYRADGNHNPSLGIDERSGKLATFWSDFRNGGPCAKDTTLGVPVPVEPCADHNNDVFAVLSNDGGATWGPTHRVTTSKAAQWQAWGDVGENGKLYVAYYDRNYGACESTGCNDITLASSKNGEDWKYRRITTSSMPNLTCDNNPAQCGFLGDYMSTVYAHARIHLAWGDTRGRQLGGVPEEDVYYARVRAR
jgi:hypothetical protein